MAVPPLIDRDTFDAVQAWLKSRNPMVTPARVTSGPTLLTGICFCAKCGGTMTLGTGRGSAGGTYRYYTCPTKARQGKTGCEGRSIPMDKLDHLVADHSGDRLLQPKRLETILASVIDRRQERTERRREHLAELHRRIADTDQRLCRLFDAIESGMMDKDTIAKERMAGLRRSGIRLENGRYRRDHLRALAQRVEVADKEVRIMGSKSELLRALVAASSEKSVAVGVQSSVLDWRAGVKETGNSYVPSAVAPHQRHELGTKDRRSSHPVATAMCGRAFQRSDSRGVFEIAYWHHHLPAAGAPVRLTPVTRQWRGTSARNAQVSR